MYGAKSNGKRNDYFQVLLSFREDLTNPEPIIFYLWEIERCVLVDV
jgi:hypothetical protein